MAYQWYVEDGGQKRGPYGSSELKRLADTGKITTASRLWRDGLPDWVEAGRINGLFSAAKPAPSQIPSTPPPLSPTPVAASANVELSPTAASDILKQVASARRSSRARTYIIIVGVVAVLFILAILNQAKNQVRSAAPVHVDEIVNNDDLCRAYFNNKLAADQRYAGKGVYVVGMVTEITNTAENLACVLDGRSDDDPTRSTISGIACVFNSNAANVAELTQFQRYDTVAIVGECTGIDQGVIKLIHCSVDPRTDKERAEAKASRMTRAEFRRKFEEIMKTGGRKGHPSIVTSVGANGQTFSTISSSDGTDLLNAFGSPDRFWKHRDREGEVSHHFEWRCVDGSVDIAIDVGFDYGEAIKDLSTYQPIGVANVEEHTEFMRSSTAD